MTTERMIKFQILPSDSQLLEQMSKEHRDILTATGTYVQIAEALKIPVGTVKSRFNRARSRLIALRETISEHA
jgi:DNA-directed RNA polymerase specialized sigma24 family protein